ncbi:TetR/AcrR family transcriptional regulator [Legionella cardiaca]|uniref:TetR/AcrR family transcriptional regulator n=1 Tax=Legionella cardiaca TaxID=1071983 RepID=A0ABY8AUZ7_9GAMM|nr:TetR/AcrR family transcriptional regulator [Legionella cardiaca]WED44509.1 TetR/AcrR family transcriptional regulator [Legionella cardiaca]
MKTSHLTAEKIMDTALYLAERSSWEDLRLFDIAQFLNVKLTDIYPHFREKNALIPAFFERADKAMLEVAAKPEILNLSSEDRLAQVLISWFSSIQNHHQVAKEMIWGQLEPGHLHVQLRALLRVSRTVQWWREAAQRSTVNFQRAIEETGLTAIYIATLMHWLYDNSEKAVETNRFLERQLKRAHWFAVFCKKLCKCNKVAS